MYAFNLSDDFFTISVNVFDDFDDFFLIFDDLMFYLSGSYGFRSCVNSRQ